MTLSTWNFEYALQLQSMKMICFRYFETSNAFIDAFFSIQKSILISQDLLN